MVSRTQKKEVVRVVNVRWCHWAVARPTLLSADDVSLHPCDDSGIEVCRVLCEKTFTDGAEPSRASPEKLSVGDRKRHASMVTDVRRGCLPRGSTPED